MPCKPDCGSCCMNITSEHPSRVQEVLDHMPKDPDNPIYQDNYKSAKFMNEHWRVIEIVDDYEAIYDCDMFDIKTRSCMAHDSRPPVCVNYPWYGKDPRLAGTRNSLANTCGYMEDVRTVLPLVAINGVDQ